MSITDTQFEETLFALTEDNFDSSVNKIIPFIDEKKLLIQHIIPILSYCSYFRPRSVSCYEKVAIIIYEKLNLEENVTIPLNQADSFFQSIKYACPKLFPSEDGFICSHILDFSFDDIILDIFINDNVNSLKVYLAESVHSQLLNQIRCAAAYYRSEKCFAFLIESMTKHATPSFLFYAFIGGSKLIVDMILEKWQLDSRTLANCYFTAYRAHNFHLIPDSFVIPFDLMIASFASKHIDTIKNPKISTVRKIFEQSVPLFDFLARCRGIQYIKDHNLEDPYVISCILGQKPSSTPNLPISFTRDFVFRWENQSCYANAVLKMLFDLPEVQNANFLNQDNPSVCEFHMAIIQYYIKSGLKEITSEYFRYFTQSESNIPFGIQNDAAEQFTYIFHECRAVNELFSITLQTFLLNIYEKEKNTVYDLIQKNSINESMIMPDKGTFKNQFTSFQGIHPTCEEPFFGNLCSCSVYTELSKYVILLNQTGQRFNDKFEQSFVFGNCFLDYIGSLSYKDNHYVYYELQDEHHMVYNDLYPGDGHTPPNYVLLVYQNISFPAPQANLSFSYPINIDWTVVQDDDPKIKIKSVIREATNLFSKQPLNDSDMQSHSEEYISLCEAYGLSQETFPDFQILQTMYMQTYKTSNQNNDKFTNPLKVTYQNESNFDAGKYAETLITEAQSQAKSQNTIQTRSQSQSNSQNTIQTRSQLQTRSSQDTMPKRPLKPTIHRSRTTKHPAPLTTKKHLSILYDHKNELAKKFKAKYANQVKISNIYKSKIALLEKQLLDAQTNPFKYCNDLTVMFIHMTRRNFDLPPNARQYTPEEKQKCLGIYMNSKNYYIQMMQKHRWILPGKSTMAEEQRKFLQQFNFADFTSRDKDSFKRVLNKWIPTFVSSKTACILAIDAICVSTRIQITKDGILGTISPEDEAKQKQMMIMKKNCQSFSKVFNFIIENDLNIEAIFVIQLIPLSHEKPVIVHFETSNKGNASLEIYQTLLDEIDIIQAEFRDKFTIYGGAADADPQYKKAHKRFRKIWMKNVKSDPRQLPLYIERIPPAMCFSPDLSHLGKRLKYRAQNNVLKQFLCLSETINYEAVLKVLNGDRQYIEFNNERWTKMNDDAVHDFFTPANFLKILNAKKYEFIEVLLPGLLLNVAFYDQCINRNERIFVMMIGFYFMFYLHSAIHTYNREETCITNPNFKPADAIWRKDQIKDYMNLTIQVIKILSEVHGSFSMARLGTLDNEHLFSATRRVCYGDNSSITTEKALKKLIVLRSIDEDPNTKKSHSRYPPAIVEPIPYKPTLDDARDANYIAQYLLILCEGKEIIKNKYNLFKQGFLDPSDESNDNPFRAFKVLLKVWDKHYFYPKHLSTNFTELDGHTENARILGTFIGNSQVRHANRNKSIDQ